jgi:preprotein translocase subunit SecB
MKGKINKKKQNNKGESSKQTTVASAEKSSSNQSVKSAQTPSSGTKEAQIAFVIQRIYLKGIVFDLFDLPMATQQDWKPEFDLNIQTNHVPLSEGMHEVSLDVTISGKIENQPAFNITVHQIGIFTIQNTTEEQFNAIAKGTCPNILLPYVRETITNLIARATLPPLYIAHFNFDAIYAQQLQRARTQAANEAGETVG